MGSINDIVGRTPVVTPDSTRSWIEGIRNASAIAGRGDLLKPSLLLRFGTDANYIRNQTMPLYTSTNRRDAQSKAIMNLVTPGMRIPHVLNWQVNEGTDQVTSTASFEMLNCLPISQIQTTLSVALPYRHHSPTIKASFVQNSLFVVEKVDGDINVGYRKDSAGYYFKEENVKFRTFVADKMTVASATAFPNPAVPADADNDAPDDDTYANSATGVGSYFLLVDDEVLRVTAKSGNVFDIPPGGRALNGVLQAHSIGAPVKLLGYGPTTGQWTGLGLFNTDDFKAQKGLLRPGNCIVSYEGWGDITGLLSHDYSPGRNYQFTGYWFITGTEPSVTEDGVPRIRVDLKGTGWIYEGQKTSPDMLQRIKTRYGQWRIGQDSVADPGRTIWKAADHDRNIPGDWVDFNSWEPGLPGSYPLQIKTMFAQHKEFFDHMNDTEMGKQCELCRAELAEWKKSHTDDPKRQLIKERQVGRHIYKQSIRVLDEDAGPIKTYIRLMATIAAAAWDHPAYGTEASYRFTKIPNKLYDNMRNVHTGLIYDGQLRVTTDDTGFKWAEPAYTDNDVIMGRGDLTCPFESSYDKAPFSQPMLDLAEANDAQVWVRREGYPVFVPRLWSFRPPNNQNLDAVGYKNLARTVDFPTENAEWFMSYGASISGYSHSVSADSIATQCWVTCTTAFESEFTIASGGTGFSSDGTQRINFSPLGGNKEGLALTGGQQQVETISLDNVKLGLDWNTNPAGWGIREERSDGTTVVPRRPPLYDGSPALQKVTDSNKEANKHPKAVEKIQRCINWFLERRYVDPYQVGELWIYQLDVDGHFGERTHQGVLKLQRFFAHRVTGLTPALTADGSWGRVTYRYADKWLTDHKEYLQTDIWWYVQNGKTWEEYVAAITGVPVPLKPGKVEIKNTKSEVLEVPKWIISPDGRDLLREVEKWQKGFAKLAINVGNRLVDDSINKATVRSIQSNLADPRIQPADIIWAEIPGHLGAGKGQAGNLTPPFTNGIFVNTINRQMDLQAGTYTATYGGHRYRGELGRGLSRGVSKGYEFLGRSGK